LKNSKGNGEKYTKGSLLIGRLLLILVYKLCSLWSASLNKLKERFDKSNFIAITFDNDQRVQAFFKKTKFNFEHIVDSKQQIMDLGVRGISNDYIIR
jgi:peroxiredoxin